MARLHGSRLSRRDLLLTAASLAIAPVVSACQDRSRASAPTLGAKDTAQWPHYDESFVIDFLGSPGYFNYPEDPPLTPDMIRNAVQSGITAMNVTVDGGDFSSTVRIVARWLDNTALYPEVFQQVRTLADLENAKSSGRMGLVFGFQDATPYEDDLDNIDVFDQMGVRVVQLTYNTRNLVGDGCLEPGNAGLSVYGLQVVERLNELGSIVDLSHCGKRTTAEGIRASTSPVAITHSGCNAVAPHPRGKDDEDLRAMADRGGVLGVYLMPFLSPGRVPTAEDVMLHIEHALNVCGEDHVAIGSDLSVTPISDSDEYWAKHREFVAERIAAGIAAPNEDPDILFTVPQLDSPHRMRLIADELHARGHSDRIVEKVIGGNWVRLLRDVWKS